MAAESSRAKWLMDLVRQVDVLTRTKLAFHWQRTLRQFQVSGDWLHNWSAALRRRASSWPNSCTVEYLKVDYEWHYSIHPSITPTLCHWCLSMLPQVFHFTSLSRLREDTSGYNCSNRHVSVNDRKMIDFFLFITVDNYLSIFVIFNRIL